MKAASSEPEFPLLVIVGPTAAGKSALALTLAKQWNGEIVNFDAMQLYRGFDIGTGKLSTEEQRKIPHHLLGCVEPEQVFTAGDFAREAARAVEDIRLRGSLPILVGGTGLYLRALLVGLFEGPKRSETIRARLVAQAKRRGREHLHRLLRRIDAKSAARIQPNDTQKIIRALEVCLLARRPYSQLLAQGRVGLRGFRPIKIGLDPGRVELAARINSRVERMFAAGLMKEAISLFAERKSEAASTASGNGPYASLGYPQAMRAARGEIAMDDAIRETQAATRRYAKRQRTWYRREPEVTWFNGFGDQTEVQAQVFEWLKRSQKTLETRFPFHPANAEGTIHGAPESSLRHLDG